jgi:hypothetical protein
MLGKMKSMHKNKELMKSFEGMATLAGHLNVDFEKMATDVKKL